MKKYVAVVTALCILSASLFSCPGSLVQAEETQDQNETSSAVTFEKEEDFSYREHLANYADAERPMESISVSAEAFLAETDSVSLREEECVMLKGEGAQVSFRVEAKTAGLYCLSFDYLPLQSNFATISFDMKINGEEQFDSMGALMLDHPWKDSEEPRKDSRGNELRPQQEQINERMQMTLKDPEGRYNEELLFYLNEGMNTVEITLGYGDFSIYGVTFFNKENTKTYEELQKLYEKEDYRMAEKDQMILLEAEDYSRKSDSSILSESDKTDAATSPSDPVKLLYNYVPGSRYQTAGQWVEYTFSPKETGLYQITLRVRQAEKSGFTSSRRLTINGEVVFSECDCISFVSSSDWYQQTIGDGKEAYEFYFEEGKEYTLRLEAIPGVMSDTTLTLDDCIFDLNELYRNIVMITGTNPDKYRDYKIGSEIPDFKEKIKNLIDTLETCGKDIQEKNGGKSGSALTAIRSLLNRLEVAATRPDSLVQKIASFKSDIESLSAWNMDAKEQPLDMDYIAVHAKGAKLPAEKANIFQKGWFELRRLIASYDEEYSAIGDFDEDMETIEVWVVNGRDQMGVIDDLVVNEFTPETGIQVKTSLVTAGINEAILADKAPDVIAYAGSDFPVTMACRGVLQELSQYEGFDEVSTWFSEGTMDAMEYKDGYYGIPLSQAYNMMFVRTDIMEEMGLEIPQTWEEMYSVAAVLQRSNMEVGIPSTSGMYATLLFQNGGEFYSEDYRSTQFDSEEAKEAFKTWTSFFSEYGFPVSYDLYNRFRSGEMPIGITSYNFYTQLEQMAPEIAGRWTMVPIPGTKMEDGTIDRSLSICNAAGVSTASGLEQGMAVATIVNASMHKEAAWKFVKWLASAEVQVEYGLDVEAVMGPLGRYTPANLEAFEQMPWTDNQKQLLKMQWEDIVILKEIPGGYAITRNINNAFRRTIYDNENPVDMLNKYNLLINKELERKYNEFLSEE